MANFAKGGQQAKDAAKEQNQKTAFKRDVRFSLADGDLAYIRLIDDHTDWIYINQHGQVPTKGAPESFSGEKDWPVSMPAVCRKSKGNDRELVFPEFGGECYICDEMHNPDHKRGKYFPSIRLWARAVLREPVLGTQEFVDAGLCKPSQIGKIFNFVDKVVEYDVLDDEDKSTGEKREEAAVVYLNFGLKNFFGSLQASADAYGTVLDRDYLVKREGKGLETNYLISPMSQVPLLDADLKPTGEFYSLEDPEIRAEYEALMDLEKLVENMASDDYFDTFFDATRPFPERWDKKDDEDEDKPAKTAPKAAPKAAAEPEESGAVDGAEAGAPVGKSRADAIRARLKAASTSAS